MKLVVSNMSLYWWVVKYLLSSPQMYELGVSQVLVEKVPPNIYNMLGPRELMYIYEETYSKYGLPTPCLISIAGVAPG